MASGLLQNSYFVLSSYDFLVFGVFVSPPDVVLHSLTDGSVVWVIAVVNDEVFCR